MQRIAPLLMLMGLCTAVLKSAEPTTTEKARSALSKETYELFKNQIKGEYPSHATAFAVAQAKIRAAKTVVYLRYQDRALVSHGGLLGIARATELLLFSQRRM